MSAIKRMSDEEAEEKISFLRNTLNVESVRRDLAERERDEARDSIVGLLERISAVALTLSVWEDSEVSHGRFYQHVRRALNWELPS